MIHVISSERLSLERLKEIIDGHAKLVLGEEATAAIIKCRKYLDSKMEDQESGCRCNDGYQWHPATDDGCWSWPRTRHNGVDPPGFVRR